MSTVYGSEGIYNFGTALARWANYIPSPLMNMKLNPWAEGHEMMKFPKKPFHTVFKEIAKKQNNENK